MNLIEMQNLTKTYRTEEVETTALNEVNLQVREGEFIAVMGPSGCGKSTLLNTIGLLDSINKGSYQFNGTDVSRMPERKRAALRKANIGFVFQNFNLIDELTVFENIELPLIYLKTPKAERVQRVQELMERVGMTHRAKHYPSQLSGGQQQRVAIARALVANPKLILADEPTGNLDSAHGNEVMELLSLLNEQGTTIVMVTHSSHDASFAQRIVRLFDGAVVNESSIPLKREAI